MSSRILFAGLAAFAVIFIIVFAVDNLSDSGSRETSAVEVLATEQIEESAVLRLRIRSRLSSEQLDALVSAKAGDLRHLLNGITRKDLQDAARIRELREDLHRTLTPESRVMGLRLEVVAVQGSGEVDPEVLNLLRELSGTLASIQENDPGI